MEWVVGTITLMAVMAAITSGGMGIRLLYIDAEYGQLIHSKSERIEGASAGHVSGPPVKSSPETRTHERHPPDTKALSDLYVKRDSNRSSVMFDGVCIIAILVAGLATARIQSQPVHVYSGGLHVFP